MTKPYWFFHFRFTFESCKICADQSCAGDVVNIINNACTDDVEFTSFMSKPISTLSTTNEYIKSINSEFSFQLAEMTLFKFPNSDERKPIFYTWPKFQHLTHISVTVSCEIALSPKQAIDENKLSFKYGQCNNPSRTLTYRKRREVETYENLKFTMKNTVKLSSQKSDASRTHLLTILIISVLTYNIW